MGEMLSRGAGAANRLALAAASAASAAVLDLIEAGRGDDVASDLVHREAAENLADALQSVLSIEHDAATETGSERLQAVGQLLAALTRFLEGWA